MAGLSDEKLLSLCLSGRGDHWQRFVERFSGLVLFTIRATLRRYGAADQSPETLRDLYQQVFLSLLEDDRRRLRAYSGRGGCSLATWLRVVVSRLIVDHLRRQEPATVPLATDPAGADPPGAAPAPADPGPSPLEELQEQEAVEFLRQEIEALPPRERLALKLRYQDGLSGQEAAELMHLKRNHLDQILWRVKERLRQRAKEKGLL